MDQIIYCCHSSFTFDCFFVVVVLVFCCCFVFSSGPQLAQSRCENVVRTFEERPRNVVIGSCENVFLWTLRNGVITLGMTLKFNITTTFLELSEKLYQAHINLESALEKKMFTNYPPRANKSNKTQKHVFQTICIHYSTIYKRLCQLWFHAGPAVQAASDYVHF